MMPSPTTAYVSLEEELVSNLDVPIPEDIIYLAGPMSGKPQFNFPAFDEAEQDLHTMGIICVSPARLASREERLKSLSSPDGLPDAFGLDYNEDWKLWLSRDLRIVMEVQAIVCLPGWQYSKGARLETYVGSQLGKQLYSYPDLNRIDRNDFLIEVDPTEYVRPRSVTREGLK
jgi:hypothetical protein